MSDASPERPASCADLACLQAHEGELVEIVGTYVFPRKKAFAHNKLSLSDGTMVIVTSPDDGGMRAQLSSENDGKRLTVRGRIYVKDIPEKYGIIGRTPDPYLMDVIAVDFSG
jgi:hypothetical protein